MKIHFFFKIATLFLSILLLSFNNLYADDCWTAINIKGETSFADDGFKITEDSIDPILICFSNDTGSVTGNDLHFVKFGNYTLIGVLISDDGMETINTFQIDTINNKVYITLSRIGTKSKTNVLSDKVAMFVGDVKKAN